MYEEGPTGAASKGGESWDAGGNLFRRASSLIHAGRTAKARRWVTTMVGGGGCDLTAVRDKDQPRDVVRGDRRQKRRRLMEATNTRRTVRGTWMRK